MMIVVVELLLLAIIAAFTVAGSKRGLLQSVGQIVGVVAGFYVARLFAPKVIPWIVPWFPHRFGLIEIMVFTTLFLMVDRVIGMALSLISRAFGFCVRWSVLTKIGSMLGGILGAMEGILVVGGILYWIRIERLDPTLLVWLSHSQVAAFVEMLFRNVLPFFV